MHGLLLFLELQRWLALHPEFCHDILQTSEKSCLWQINTLQTEVRDWQRELAHTESELGSARAPTKASNNSDMSIRRLHKPSITPSKRGEFFLHSSDHLTLQPATPSHMDWSWWQTCCILAHHIMPAKYQTGMRAHLLSTMFPSQKKTLLLFRFELPKISWIGEVFCLSLYCTDVVRCMQLFIPISVTYRRRRFSPWVIRHKPKWTNRSHIPEECSCQIYTVCKQRQYSSGECYLSAQPNLERPSSCSKDFSKYCILRYEQNWSS